MSTLTEKIDVIAQTIAGDQKVTPLRQELAERIAAALDLKDDKTPKQPVVPSGLKMRVWGDVREVMATEGTVLVPADHGMETYGKSGLVVTDAGKALGYIEHVKSYLDFEASENKTVAKHFEELQFRIVAHGGMKAPAPEQESANA